jgi:hypothetical protein
MIVSSYKDFYFDANCPICGYSIWTDERIPEDEDIEIAKRKLAEMDESQKDNAVEQFYENNVPFIARYKKVSG